MIREGDWFIVTALDRIGRSLTDQNYHVSFFKSKNVRLISFPKDFDFCSLTGNLLFQVMASVAEYERNIIRETQLIGILAAKSRGAYKGRKPVPMPLNFEECFLKYKNCTRVQRYTLKMFASETNLKMSTLINFINRSNRSNSSKPNV